MTTMPTTTKSYHYTQYVCDYTSLAAGKPSVTVKVAVGSPYPRAVFSIYKQQTMQLVSSHTPGFTAFTNDPALATDLGYVVVRGTSPIGWAERNNAFVYVSVSGSAYPSATIEKLLETVVKAIKP